MKNKTLLTLSILVIFIAIGVLYFFDQNLSQEDIKNIVLEETSKYCNYLEEKATYSACETCRGNQNYVLVKEFSETSNLSQSEYTLTNLKDGSKIEVKMNSIFGFNTRTGSDGFSFTIDKKGNIITPPEYPEETCLG